MLFIILKTVNTNLKWRGGVTVLVITCTREHMTESGGGI